MKTKFMSLVMAAGLGIMCITGTVQAAGTDTASSNCKHETLNYFEYFMSADYYNGQYHRSRYRTGYECSKPDCFYTTLVGDEYRLESHDYEQIYYQDGRVKSICTGCDDSFFW